MQQKLLLENGQKYLKITAYLSLKLYKYNLNFYLKEIKSSKQ